jgi:hypothetical protein
MMARERGAYGSAGGRGQSAHPHAMTVTGTLALRCWWMFAVDRMLTYLFGSMTLGSQRLSHKASSFCAASRTQTHRGQASV